MYDAFSYLMVAAAVDYQSHTTLQEQKTCLVFLLARSSIM